VSKATKKAGSLRARATERKIAHAVIHPVRLDALSILFEQVASPKEIHQILRVPLATVSFHVSELLADGAIELVKTKPRRGAVEHYYRAKLRPEVSDEEWRALPRNSRRKFAATLLQAIIAESLASLRHGEMEADDDLHLTWMPMRLDVQGCKELADLQAEMLERFAAVKADGERRLGDDPDGTGSERIVAILGFERSLLGRSMGDAFDITEFDK
jgi:DNA-binding transcriptional ArsR family regulator